MTRRDSTQHCKMAIPLEKWRVSRSNVDANVTYVASDATS